MSDVQRDESSPEWWEIVTLCAMVVLAFVAGAHAVAHGLSLLDVAGFMPLIGVGIYARLKYDIVGTPKRRKP